MSDVTGNPKLPRVVSSPDESWFAVLVPTRDEAVDVFVNEVGFDRDGMDGALEECRLARVPVPDEYRDEYPEWFEKQDGGSIVAWEIRL